MQMLGGRQGMGAPAAPQQSSGGFGGNAGGYDEPDFSPAPPRNKPKPSFDDLGDDIPF